SAYPLCLPIFLLLRSGRRPRATHFPYTTLFRSEGGGRGMERLPMSKILEILRLRWLLALTVRQTSFALGVSTGTVSSTTSRAEMAGLTWEAAAGLEERELEERVYGVPAAIASRRPEPDPVWIHLELKRPGVTLELLHLEYLREHEGGEPYQYTAFCNRYRKWLKARGLSMRQEHRAGWAVFVDFSGKK